MIVKGRPFSCVVLAITQIVNNQWSEPSLFLIFPPIPHSSHYFYPLVKESSHVSPHSQSVEIILDHPLPRAHHNRCAVFGSDVPLGILCGLIALGGAEFRLPLLIGVFPFAPRKAVLNKAMSLVVVAFAWIFVP